MSRCFLTGDTHGKIDFDKMIKFNKEHSLLTKDDLVIVLGDFGVIWNDNYMPETNRLIKQYDEFNFSTAFILGNHEGYDLLKDFPKERWNDGMVKRISNSIIQLINGEIYSLHCNGGIRDVFVMGGAKSVDKDFRIKGVDWWPQEVPSLEERCNALQNLLNYSCKYEQLPKYILTHTPPQAIIKQLYKTSFFTKEDEYSRWLNFLLNLDDYNKYVKWYCGHMHEDTYITNPFYSDDNDIGVKEVRILYDDFVELI